MKNEWCLCSCAELIGSRWGDTAETVTLVTRIWVSFIHPSTCHRSRNRRPECWHTGPEPRRRTAILQTFLCLAQTRGNNKNKKKQTKQKQKTQNKTRKGGRCKARQRQAANPDLYSLSVPVFVRMFLRKQVHSSPHHPRWSAQSG